jgi:TolB-like protein
MKKHFPLVALLAVYQLLTLYTPSISQNKTAIAVLNFEAKNVSHETAEAVADILSTELFNTKRFEVIERQAITRILEEQKLQMTGITDMSQAAEIGKVLNVKKIMIGSVSKLGQTYIINTRLVDVQTGAMELAQTAKSENGEDGLPSAIADLVATISQKITIEGSVIKVTPNVILVDLGKSKGIEIGQMLAVFRIGDVITDLGGTIIGKSEDIIGSLRISSVKPEYSEAEVIETKTTLRLGDKVRLTTTPIEIKKSDDVKKQYKVKKVVDPNKENQAAPPPVF